MRRIGQEEDVEGQSLRLRDGEGNDWLIGGDRVKRIAWRGPDGTVHDVEGQALKGRFSRDADVEGHNMPMRRLDAEEDVEGHDMPMRRLDAEGDDVEGHMPMRRFSPEEGEKVTVTYIDDAGNEQDVEGHMPMRRIDAEGDEDVEGHMPMRR